ncbi:hypothetical protein [Lusitaniella coriacea]|uniref:hypothetical protein n=1 Tax=Lusitaniella coriacea TaxID=1983105 RepID=UPI003CE72F08
MATEHTNPEFENWARERKLGNLKSPITRRLYENRNLTVQEYISQFRKASLNAILPEEAKLMSVEDAIEMGRVGNVNIRKLLTDQRDKFTK